MSKKKSLTLDESTIGVVARSLFFRARQLNDQVKADEDKVQDLKVAQFLRTGLYPGNFGLARPGLPATAHLELRVFTQGSDNELRSTLTMVLLERWSDEKQVRRVINASISGNLQRIADFQESLSLSHSTDRMEWNAVRGLPEFSQALALANVSKLPLFLVTEGLDEQHVYKVTPFEDKPGADIAYLSTNLDTPELDTSELHNLFEDSDPDEIMPVCTKLVAQLEDRVKALAAVIEEYEIPENTRFHPFFSGPTVLADTEVPLPTPRLEMVSEAFAGRLSHQVNFVSAQGTRHQFHCLTCGVRIGGGHSMEDMLPLFPKSGKVPEIIGGIFPASFHDMCHYSQVTGLPAYYRDNRGNLARVEVLPNQRYELYVVDPSFGD